MTTSGYYDLIADEYDLQHAPSTEETQAAVKTLFELAGGGPVLELGIGTGRVALPLAEKGLAVHGIENSVRMVTRLKSKPGARDVIVNVQSFAEPLAGPPFTLIYVIFNTLFCLNSQELQVVCFLNVAERLTPGGVFVLEVFTPSFFRGQGIVVPSGDYAAPRLQITQHDGVTQRIIRHELDFLAGVKAATMVTRYAWPSELDLMARLAGLRLKARWSSWEGSSFTNESVRHISTYEKPSTPSDM